MKIQYNLPCNIAQTLNIIGDKWSLLILHQLLIGRETYKEIQDGLEGIPTNLLSERLKSMETDELILRELYQSHPPRYKYTLTDKGFDLVDVFNSLMMWGEKHLNKCYKTVVHKNCGGKVEHRYYCPECGNYINSDELSVTNSIKDSEVKNG
ncbi:helix-turn-helix domain-containing protein [Sedimentibacter sp. B4]|uniref:winged helix-turn-helix transcriptional regulator n=1 Tax=Sedimentibacter sp. B4 TaxID=304766 RepID=UPI0002F6470B|nr:helix-turn-helix domain-containing protein [Sedimentibacter sp. B4]